MILFNAEWTSNDQFGLSTPQVRPVFDRPHESSSSRHHTPERIRYIYDNEDYGSPVPTRASELRPKGKASLNAGPIKILEERYR